MKAGKSSDPRGQNAMDGMHKNDEKNCWTGENNFIERLA